jgi:DNA repair protein RecO (recombination protein O)
MYKKTTGIILRRKKIGEADKLLVIFTTDLGKITALAKGIERISSKRAGHLELFMISQLELRKSKNNNYLICEAKALNNFKSLRNNLYKAALACYLIELTDKITSWQERNIHLFSLLKEALLFLEEVENTHLYNVVYSFEMQLINLLGFRLELNNCLHCQKKVSSPKLYFSILEGGIFCPNCRSYNMETIGIQKEIIIILRFLQGSSFRKSLQLSKQKLKKISYLMNFYIKFILEQDLQSKRVIKKLKTDRYFEESKKENKRTISLAEETSR